MTTTVLMPGTQIPVRENGQYTGQDMEWTEACLGAERLKEEKVFFHSSGHAADDEPLLEFRAKETCMYEGYAVVGHVYAIRVPAGTLVRKYRGGERRVTLTPDMEVTYIGQILYDYANDCSEIWTGHVKIYMEKYGDEDYLPLTWRNK